MHAKTVTCDPHRKALRGLRDAADAVASLRAAVPSDGDRSYNLSRIVARIDRLAAELANDRSRHAPRAAGPVTARKFPSRHAGSTPRQVV